MERERAKRASDWRVNFKIANVRREKCECQISEKYDALASSFLSEKKMSFFGMLSMSMSI